MDVIVYIYIYIYIVSLFPIIVLLHILCAFFPLQPCHCSVACLEPVLHCYPFRPVHGIYLNSVTCWMNTHHSSLPCIMHALFMHTITGHRLYTLPVFSTVTPFTAMSYASSHTHIHTRIESIVITTGINVA